MYIIFNAAHYRTWNKHINGIYPNTHMHKHPHTRGGAKVHPNAGIHLRSRVGKKQIHRRKSFHPSNTEGLTPGTSRLFANRVLTSACGFTDDLRAHTKPTPTPVERHR